MKQPASVGFAAHFRASLHALMYHDEAGAGAGSSEIMGVDARRQA